MSRPCIEEWVGKIGGEEAPLGSQDKVQVFDNAEPLVGMQWETAKPLEVDEVSGDVLTPVKKDEAKMGGPTHVGSNLGPLVMCYVEEKGWVDETQGPLSKNWKKLAREVKLKIESERKSPTNETRECVTPLQELDQNIKTLHDNSNSLQASKNDAGTAQAKWKCLSRMVSGNSSPSTVLVGSKRPMDRVLDPNELPNKKTLVSHSDKENHFVLAAAGSQPRQEP